MPSGRSWKWILMNFKFPFFARGEDGLGIIHPKVDGIVLYGGCTGSSRQARRDVCASSPSGLRIRSKTIVVPKKLPPTSV